MLLYALTLTLCLTHPHGLPLCVPATWGPPAPPPIARWWTMGRARIPATLILEALK